MGFADAAKAKKLTEAMRRSKTSIRETSSESTDNSQLTSSPPTVYRLGKLNIPKDMAGMTKLLHSELQKIEQSQSVILSIAEKVNAMTSIVETVNGTAPDDDGNVQVDTGVMAVNGALPDADGNITVDSGGVKTVNDQQPDAAGNVAINVGVLTVNGNAPDATGNITITYDPSENYALIEGLTATKGGNQVVPNPFGSGTPCQTQVELSNDDGETWQQPWFIYDGTGGQGTRAAWVVDDIYVISGSQALGYGTPTHTASLPATVNISSGMTTAMMRIHCWR